MALFDSFFGKNSSGNNAGHAGAIAYGKQKKDGSHDHRKNTGNDRTPAQKDADKKRRS
jgi:hypothetical protein